MAKNAYVGVNNKAKKIKNIYVGIDNKARKVKSAYIGVLTDNNVTELQGKEITLWRNYFTAENSSDYPVDWSGYTQGDDRYIRLKFGNYGVNNSTSYITLTSKYDLQNCKIEGQYHTEKNYDKITVKVNDETVLDAVSGESTFVDIWEGNLSKGDTLYFYYSKDNSKHATDENITLFEFRCDLIEEITEVVTQTKSGAPFRNLFFQEYTEEQVYKKYQTGSNGTNNWENNNAGEDHSPYRMLLSDYPNGDSSVDARRVIGPNGYTVHLEKGHKYYFSCYVYTDNVLSTFDLYWPILEPVAIRAAETVAKNNVRISAIFDRSRFSTGDYPVRFDCNNPSTSPMKITDITLVDLTATFGAGNEPNVTWCDANIPYHGGPQGVIPGIATARLCYNSDGTNFDKIQPVTVEESGAPAEMEA